MQMAQKRNSDLQSVSMQAIKSNAMSRTQGIKKEQVNLLFFAMKDKTKICLIYYENYNAFHITKNINIFPHALFVLS